MNTPFWRGARHGLVLATLVGEPPFALVMALTGHPYFTIMAIVTWVIAVLSYRERVWERD